MIATLPYEGWAFHLVNCAIVVRIVLKTFNKGPAEMKTLSTWVVAIITCSVIATQAHADVFMIGALSGVRDVNASRSVRVGQLSNASVEIRSVAKRFRPAFVSGSLINKTSTGTWLMAQCARREAPVHLRKVDTDLRASRGHKITPIPPSGSVDQPISTFAHFVQKFKNHGERGVVQTNVGDHIGAVPSTSSMTLIGLIAVTIAGITASIGASRSGLVSLMPHHRRAQVA